MWIDDELHDTLRNREFKKVNGELEKELYDSSVLVHDDFDEKQSLQKLWESETRRRDTLEVTYALTFKCNMKCSYCVQSEIKEESECTCNVFVRWLSELLKIRKPRCFHLTFFGGEPLLKKQSITTIAASINLLCKELNIEFEFGITTNGTLINPVDIIKWKSFGLKNLDVTVDGEKDTHDGKRVYKDGTGTFDDIIKNLKKLKGILPVNLICNLAPTNVSHVEYLEYLSEQTNEIEIKNIRFKPYYDKSVGGCFFGDCHIGAMEEIMSKAHSLSLPVEREFIFGPCGYFDNNFFAVSPCGDIYPCTPFFGKKEFALGTVCTDEKLEKTHSLEDNLSDECLFCSFCPVCFGGCRFVSLIEKGDVSSTSCEKRFFQSNFDNI